MKLHRLVVVVATALLLSACASGPKMAEVKDAIPVLAADKGRVYFYRSNSMLGAAIQPSIVMNGTVVGESKPGGFFFVDQTPGSVEVATTTEVEKKLTFALEPQQVRYVRTSVGFGLMVGRVYPELVDAETAVKEIEDTSYIGQPLGKE